MRDDVLVHYSDAYVGAGHAFDTTRKARWVADSLTARPIDGIVLREPPVITEAQLAAVHDPTYVAAIRTGQPSYLAESNGFGWDPGLWTGVCASTAGAVEAAEQALLSAGVMGSLSSGLHHARRGRGAGFCTFNGLALGAKRALDLGARKVLILDLDAHCGGGTADICADDPRIASIDIAVDPFDRYVARGNFTLDEIDAAEDYLPTLRRRLDAFDVSSVDLVLYNAGMDPSEGSAVGGLRGMTKELLAEREETVFAWCEANRKGVAFVLAGGYTSASLLQDELVDLHRLTLEAASRHGTGS